MTVNSDFNGSFCNVTDNGIYANVRKLYREFFHIDSGAMIDHRHVVVHVEMKNAIIWVDSVEVPLKGKLE